MSYQKIILKKLLEDKSYSLFTKLDKSFFTKTNRLIFTMVEAYYDKYKKFPEIDVLKAYATTNFNEEKAGIVEAVLDSLVKVKENLTDEELLQEVNKDRIIRSIDNKAEEFLEALKEKNIEKIIAINQYIQNETFKLDNKMPEDIKDTDYRMEGLATLPIFLDSLRRENVNLAGVSIVGAKSGLGKSVFSLQQALYTYEQGYNVGVLSLELPLSMLKARMYSLVNNTPYQEVIQPEYKDKILKWQEEYFRPNSFFVKAIRYNTYEIKKAIDLLIKNGCKLIVIDYLNLVEASDNKEEWKQLSSLIKDLHAICVEHNVVILTPTQINISEDKKGSVEVTTRGSRELEYSSSLFLLLHQNKEEYKENIARVIIKKARNSKKIISMAKTDFEHMKFIDTGIIIDD